MLLAALTLRVFGKLLSGGIVSVKLLLLLLR
jgi:hypothetical protein